MQIEDKIKFVKNLNKEAQRIFNLLKKNKIAFEDSDKYFDHFAIEEYGGQTRIMIYAEEAVAFDSPEYYSLKLKDFFNIDKYIKNELKKENKMSKVFEIITIVLFFIILIWIMFGVKTCSGVISKVVTPDNIVMNYEWYYNMYNAIDAQKRNVMVIDKSRPERLGAIMVLNNTIAEYNSKSAQISRNLWKSKDLPYSIPMFEENN